MRPCEASQIVESRIMLGFRWWKQEFHRLMGGCQDKMGISWPSSDQVWKAWRMKFQPSEFLDILQERISLEAAEERRNIQIIRRRLAG